jgi:hypothetical protein
MAVASGSTMNKAVQQVVEGRLFLIIYPFLERER